MTNNIAAAEGNLLRATQLLVTASRTEVQGDLADNLPEVLLQGAVRALVWQAAGLLPADTPLVGGKPDQPGLLAALEQAETQLRTRPIWEYPDGTTDLVINICDAIALTKAGAWL